MIFVRVVACFVLYCRGRFCREDPGGRGKGQGVQTFPPFLRIFLYFPIQIAPSKWLDPPSFLLFRPYQINYLFIIPSLSNFWPKAKNLFIFCACARCALIRKGRALIRNQLKTIVFCHGADPHSFFNKIQQKSSKHP